MHGGAGGGIGGPLPGEPKDPWEVRRQLVSAAVRTVNERDFVKLKHIKKTLVEASSDPGTVKFRPINSSIATVSSCAMHCKHAA